MKISSITINNYRSFGAGGVRIEPKTGLNLILGPNNSGKSSLFGALVRGFDQSFGSGVFPLADHRFGVTRPSMKVELSLEASDRDILTPILFGEAKAELAQRRFESIDQNVAELWSLWLTATFEISPDLVNGFDSEFKLGTYRVDGSVVISGSGGSPVGAVFALRQPRDGGPTRYFQQDISGIAFIPALREAFSARLRSKIFAFSDVRGRPVGGYSNQEGPGVSHSLDSASTAAFLNAMMNGSPSDLKRFQRIRETFSTFFPDMVFRVARRRDTNPELLF